MSEELVKEKLIQDGRYTFDDEINKARNILLSDNPNFSNNMLDAIYTKTAFRDSLVFSEIDIENLRAEAQRERDLIRAKDPELIREKFDAGSRLSRTQKDILLDVYGINVDF